MAAGVASNYGVEAAFASSMEREGGRVTLTLSVRERGGRGIPGTQYGSEGSLSVMGNFRHRKDVRFLLHDSTKFSVSPLFWFLYTAHFLLCVVAVALLLVCVHATSQRTA